MYEFIKGTVVATGADHLIIDNNGIGYRIFSSVNTVSKFRAGDTGIVIHTYLHVREDIMMLYGFADNEELSLFKMLISISGIGPKAGLAILSTFTPHAVALAIAGNDPKELSKAKGIGKKTAERIILELKDKFKALEKEAAAASPAADKDKGLHDDAKTALMVLGYSASDSRKAVDACIDEKMTLEELIRKCLNYMNG